MMDTHEKKELKDRYKRMQPRMGVFAIIHRGTSRCFLDISTDIPSMFNRIEFQLKMGMHPCKSLQADWKAEGESAFAFEVLDTLTYRDEVTRATYVEELKTLKAMWIEKLNHEGNLTLYPH